MRPVLATKISRRGALFALACGATILSGLVTTSAPAQQRDDGDWIGTWTASPQPVWGADFFEPVGSVAVSLFLPEITPTTTWHNESVQTAYISGDGNFAGDATFEPAQEIRRAG